MNISKIKFYMEQELLDKIISVAKTMSMDDLKSSLGDYYFAKSFFEVTEINKVKNDLWLVCMEDGTSHLCTEDGLKASIDYDDVADYILRLSDAINTSKTYNKFFKTCWQKPKQTL